MLSEFIYILLSVILYCVQVNHLKKNKAFAREEENNYQILLSFSFVMSV